MTLPEGPITGPFATTLELVDAVLERAGDAEAFVDADGRCTFAQWMAAADSAASWLRDLGVRQGDVVALHLPSSIDYAVAYQAALRLGAIATGVNPRLGEAEVASIVRRCDPAVVIRDTSMALAALPDSRAVVVTRGDLRAAAAADHGAPPRPKVDPEDPVAIVWTSGTTGQPKGAWFDHECLRAMVRGAGVLSQVGDRRLSPLPFAHVGYMTRVWDELQHVITTIVVPTPWTAADAIRLIRDERVTVCQGVPAQYALMLRHPDMATADLSSLRIVATGAAKTPPEQLQAMIERFGCPVVVRYASTEGCLATGTLPGDSVDDIVNTVGRPSGGVELVITDDEGVPVPAGVVGTVRLRTRAMMRGYWNDPERTAECITADGWLVTGDLGSVDERGYLTLVGRRTEMYIRSGYNVYPLEVENQISLHPAVAQVAVVATPAPVIGEQGVAFVVPAPGAEPPTLQDLRAWLKGRLADYKAPDRIEIVSELPLTSMSKIDKRALAARLASEQSGDRR